MIIKIDGKEIKTEMVNDVQRLPSNPLYDALFKCGALDLNKLTVAYHLKKISFEHYLEIYLNIGYSVSGFSDLEEFAHLKIENPLWE